MPKYRILRELHATDPTPYVVVSDPPAGTRVDGQKVLRVYDWYETEDEARLATSRLNEPTD